MKKLWKTRLNNDGSTMVFVVVTIVFIGLLASLILALSVAGYKMKSTDYSSRRNFYEGEEYSGKIYSDIGMNSLGILGESYVNTVNKVNSGAITGKNELNSYLKKLYYKNMMLFFKLVEKNLSDPADTALDITLSQPVIEFTRATNPDQIDNVENYLKEIISRPERDALGAVITPDPLKIPKLEIKGSIVCKPEGGKYEDGTTYPTITINNVHLSYIDGNNNFESNYTFDIIVKYPDWDFAYASPVSEKADIDTFVDYVFLANGAITFEAGSGNTVNVYGNVAAGNNSTSAVNDDTSKGIYINNCAVKFNGNAANWYEQMVVIASDNIVVNSSLTSNADVTFNGGKVWCNSIILNKPTTPDGELNTNRAQLNVSMNAGLSGENIYPRLYIQDDLELNGVNSKANVSNAYYYGYGTNTTSGGTAADTSSAIIVNGSGSNINLSQMKGLYIYGLAYVDLIGTDSYRTGESLTVKSNQDIYLVPDAYMGEGGANPTRKNVSVNDIKNLLAGGSSAGVFFGYEYLDKTEPVITRTYTLNGKQYNFYYLNFESPFEQSYYVQKALGTEKLSAAQENVRSAIKERVYENLSDLNTDGTEHIMNYSMADGVTPFTVGAMITARGGIDKNSSSILDNVSTATLADATTSANLYRKRYRLMKSLLLDVTSTENLDDYHDVLCQDLSVTDKGKRNYDSAKYNSDVRDIDNLQLSRSATTNFINWNRLAVYANGGVWNRSHSILGMTATLRYVNTGGTYNLTGNFTGVLVVDGDVVINGNITGLVVSSGSITVKSGGSYTSNPELVHKLLSSEQVAGADNSNDPRSDVFYFYPLEFPSSGDTIDAINALDYSDVLYYDNWRRYEGK